MEFRDALKMFRNELGLAQADIAIALHINIATVGRWEQGKNVPNRSCGIALLEYAKSKSATSACIENLQKSLRNATKQKLFSGKDSLFTVEHASISRLIEDAAFPIYVCDLTTDEILYINHATEQHLGQSLDELVGKKCYECVMGRDKPCEFCHKNELVDDRFSGYDACWPIDGKIYHVQGKLIQWNGRSAQVRYVLGAGSSPDLMLNDALNIGGTIASHAKSTDDAPIETPLLQNMDNEKSVEQLMAIFENINGGVSVDHALLQNLFKDQFIIEKAKDGNTALIRLRHYGSAISVVLLDLMMPGMDGFAVLEKMQESAELRAIPVIMVSGDESRETCLTAIRMGAIDFITKPVDVDVLRSRVHSAVSKAENERLRAKNSMLEYQNSELARYKAAMESGGVIVIENDWISDTFIYDSAIAEHLAGHYDNRGFWRILLSDFVAETATVQMMQNLVQQVVAAREQHTAQTVIRLKTPAGKYNRFRMNVKKKADEFGLAVKLYMTFVDLGEDEAKT